MCEFVISSGKQFYLLLLVIYLYNKNTKKLHIVKMLLLEMENVTLRFSQIKKRSKICLKDKKFIM